MKGYITFHMDAGLQHMNGDIALKYADTWDDEGVLNPGDQIPFEIDLGANTSSKAIDLRL